MMVAMVEDKRTGSGFGQRGAVAALSSPFFFIAVKFSAPNPLEISSNSSHLHTLVIST
jgi:hypothetical protein